MKRWNDTDPQPDVGRAAPDRAPARPGSTHRMVTLVAVSFLLVCAAFVFTQLVLEHATLESPKFNQNALMLLIFSVFNFIILFGLAIILARHLIKLYFERKSRRLGSKFKVKLVS